MGKKSGKKNQKVRVFALNQSVATTSVARVTPEAFVNSPPSRAASLATMTSLSDLFPDQPMHKITLCEDKEWRKKGQVGKTYHFHFNGEGKSIEDPGFIQRLKKEIESREGDLDFMWGQIQIKFKNESQSYNMEQWLEMGVTTSCRCC
jgi:hypothetical protein